MAWIQAVKRSPKALVKKWLPIVVVLAAAVAVAVWYALPPVPQPWEYAMPLTDFLAQDHVRRSGQRSGVQSGSGSLGGQRQQGGQIDDSRRGAQAMPVGPVGQAGLTLNPHASGGAVVSGERDSHTHAVTNGASMGEGVWGGQAQVHESVHPIQEARSHQGGLVSPQSSIHRVMSSEFPAQPSSPVNRKTQPFSSANNAYAGFSGHQAVVAPGAVDEPVGKAGSVGVWQGQPLYDFPDHKGQGPESRGVSQSGHVNSSVPGGVQ